MNNIKYGGEIISTINLSQAWFSTKVVGEHVRLTDNGEVKSNIYEFTATGTISNDEIIPGILLGFELDASGQVFIGEGFVIEKNGMIVDIKGTGYYDTYQQ